MLGTPSLQPPLPTWEHKHLPVPPGNRTGKLFHLKTNQPSPAALGPSTQVVVKPFKHWAGVVESMEMLSPTRRDRHRLSYRQPRIARGWAGGQEQAGLHELALVRQGLFLEPTASEGRKQGIKEIHPFKSSDTYHKLPFSHKGNQSPPNQCTLTS